VRCGLLFSLFTTVLCNSWRRSCTVLPIGEVKEPFNLQLSLQLKYHPNTTYRYRNTHQSTVRRRVLLPETWAVLLMFPGQPNALGG
jgi:hypothetical protein